MSRVYNFSPGPSVLPLKVLETAAAEMTNYNGSGLSVMEMSHRSPIYEAIINEAESVLREIMKIPDNYKVLFLQGGASLQFASVPLNLLNGTGKADYVLSGQFSSNAYEEAKKYGDIKVLASSKDKTFSYIPAFTKDDVRPDADYVHICQNNTIYGTKFNGTPDTGNVPLVADMSSCILSEEFDVTKYGVIYAGAQKNMGPSGLTVVIIRDDLIGNAHKLTPKLMDYKIQADNSSMVNTPPCYSIYIALLVFKWLRDDMGGIAQIQKINESKAANLYDFLDNSSLFKGTADKNSRSIMNVPFVTGSDDLDKKFVKDAEKAGLITLKGHRSVGGMRASIYNAMPTSGIDALIAFMKKFELENK